MVRKLKDDLGDRMKSLEDEFRIYLPKKRPLIIRVDGKGFSAFTRKNFKDRSPFSPKMNSCMEATAKGLLTEIEGAVFAYRQSDEISVFVKDYRSEKSEAWFGNNLQKISSVSASIATAYFNKNSGIDNCALFDSRCFVLDFDEVLNYFIWRQKDAIRNSISMLAHYNKSVDETFKKSSKELVTLLRSSEIDWESLESGDKFGTFYFRSKEAEGGVVSRSFEICNYKSSWYDLLEGFVNDCSANYYEYFFGGVCPDTKASKVLRNLYRKNVNWGIIFKNWMKEICCIAQMQS